MSFPAIFSRPCLDSLSKQLSISFSLIELAFSHRACVHRQLQEETLAALSKERKHYDEDLSSALEAVAPVFGKMEAYTEKAARMAKQMQSITARVNKLKARASSIQMNAHKQAAKKK